MKDVVDKVAFVTGGSSGIGQGLVRVLSAAGMKVAFSYRRDDHLQDTLRVCRNARHRLLPIHLDVTDRQGMERAARTIEDHFGGVDLLINNAAVNLFTPMDEARFEDWDWLIDVNLKGVINGLVTFLPRMKARHRGGHIVNTASMGSFIAGPNAGIYTTTKFALRGLTESLRYCLAEHRIGVSLLCPGLVASNIYESEVLRPANYGDPVMSEALVGRLRKIQGLGMDPLLVAERTLEGILNNDLYIFTHPDHKQELRAGFDRILSCMPEGEVAVERADVERQRRQRITEIETLIQNMEH